MRSFFSENRLIFYALFFITILIFSLMYYFPDAGGWVWGTPIYLPLSLVILYTFTKAYLKTKKEERDARPDSKESIQSAKEKMKRLKSLIPYYEEEIQELEALKFKHFENKRLEKLLIDEEYLIKEKPRKDSRLSLISNPSPENSGDLLDWSRDELEYSSEKRKLEHYRKKLEESKNRLDGMNIK
jgi:cellulose synthase/poly-beta-1,6-N-acetylglucosamine synthase-like glycosyltransferase